MMVNHSVEDFNLGKVNGIGQSVAATARAVGPALGGVIWSISLRHEVVFANFAATAFVLLICEYIVFQIPATIDFKKGHQAITTEMSMSQKGEMELPALEAL